MRSVWAKTYLVVTSRCVVCLSAALTVVDAKMADVIANVTEQLPETNATTTETNGTAAAGAGVRIPATPEGAALAYASIILMAALPIFMGAYRSVKHHREMKASGEKTDTLTRKDAAMFPIIASAALLGLYVFFQVADQTRDPSVFSKEYINMLLTGYFFFLGVLALAHILSPVFVRFAPKSLPANNYHLHFTQGENETKEDIINYKFDNRDVVCFAFSLIFGLWYLWKKHWIANNLFGLAFAINGVELLHLNNIVTGCILLGGLFFYDIFWVFGTDVMVTVAKSFEAPIKLVFPQDLLEKGFEANNFAMLGLGDIVIPGIFIALLLRFDVSRNIKGGSNTYFNAGFIAYIGGLLATILVMHVFKHAQPALLYLVPACLGLPLLVALIKGDLKDIFRYEDNPPDEEPVKTTKGKTSSQSKQQSAQKEK